MTDSSSKRSHSRTQEIESTMRSQKKLQHGGTESAMERLMSMSLRDPESAGSGAENESPRRTREKRFWNGPFSPNSGRLPPGRQQPTPRRLGSQLGSRRSLRNGDSVNGRTHSLKSVAGPPPEPEEVDPVVAVQRMLRLMKISRAKDFVCELLLALADDLGCVDTVTEVRKFMYLEQCRSNRLENPPEGWDSVREALIEFHGSIRAAFTNMCGGRRGGVMSAEELHRGLIAISMPHVTELVLNAVCPEQAVSPQDIFIDYEEFAWIMNGCQAEPLTTSPRILAHDKSEQLTHSSQPRSPQVHHQQPQQHRRASSNSDSPSPQHLPRESSSDFAKLQQRLAILEDSLSRQSPVPLRPCSPADEGSPNWGSKGLDRPNGVHDDGHSRRDSQQSTVSLAVSLGQPRPPSSPLVDIWQEHANNTLKPTTSTSYAKSGSPTSAPRRASISSLTSQTGRYTTPPRSIPPDRRADMHVGGVSLYPAKVAAPGLQREVSRPMVVRAPSPVTVRPPSPAAFRAGSPGYRTSSPTAVARQYSSSTPLGVSPLTPSLSGTLNTAFDTSRRISSSLKSPVRQGSSRAPGMISPPVSRPPQTNGFRNDSDLDQGTRSGYSSPQGEKRSIKASSAKYAQPFSPGSFKRPPTIRRGSLSVYSDVSMTRGHPPPPPDTKAAAEG
ncbi:hypothetical protein DIPPA_07892 [Diplonema papillatum]|nr:hypothetical protein DIPPA_07892 [Diplonema papillatum]